MALVNPILVSTLSSGMREKSDSFFAGSSDNHWTGGGLCRFRDLKVTDSEMGVP